MAVVTFINSVTNIAPTAGAGWTDVDVSGTVPSGATGVILRLKNDGGGSGGSRSFGVRNNGSTDDIRDYVRAGTYNYVFIGIDSSRIFEASIGNADIEVYLHGYFEDNVTFFTNSVDKSLGTTSSWTDIDISSDTGADTAIGAILLNELSFATAELHYGYRKNGSTDTTTVETDNYQNYFGAIIGVDGSEIFEQNIDSTSIDTHLVGYITDDATFNTNAIDVEVGSGGSYQDMTALAGGSSALGGIYFLGSPNTLYSYGVRANGSSDDYYEDISGFVVSDCDGSGVCEAKMENIFGFIYEIGYFEAGGNEQSASVSPLGMTLTPTATTATYAEVTNASVSPLVLNITDPGVTANYLQVEQATVSPLALNLSPQLVTADYDAILSASVDPLQLNLSPQALTANYLQENNASVSPLQLTLTPTATTASYLQEESATVSPIALNLNIVGITANYEEIDSATVFPLQLNLTLPLVTATSGEVYNATVSPLGLQITNPITTANYIQLENAVVSPLLLSITQPSITANYEAIIDASVSPLLTELLIVSQTASYIQIDNAVVLPTLINMTFPEVTANQNVTNIIRSINVGIQEGGINVGIQEGGINISIEKQ